MNDFPVCIFMLLDPENNHPQAQDRDYSPHVRHSSGGGWSKDRSEGTSDYQVS